VLHFLDGNLHVLKDRMFEVPPLFQLIQSESQTEWKEMYKVFNMGHRLEIYTTEKYAHDIINVSRSFGVDAQIVGQVQQSSGPTKLTLETPFGSFQW